MSKATFYNLTIILFLLYHSDMITIDSSVVLAVVLLLTLPGLVVQYFLHLLNIKEKAQFPRDYELSKEQLKELDSQLEESTQSHSLSRTVILSIICLLLALIPICVYSFCIFDVDTSDIVNCLSNCFSNPRILIISMTFILLIIPLIVSIILNQFKDYRFLFRDNIIDPIDLEPKGSDSFQMVIDDGFEKEKIFKLFLHTDYSQNQKEKTVYGFPGPNASADYDLEEGGIFLDIVLHKDGNNLKLFKNSDGVFIKYRDIYSIELLDYATDGE